VVRRRASSKQPNAVVKGVMKHIQRQTHKASIRELPDYLLSIFKDARKRRPFLRVDTDTIL